MTKFHAALQRKEVVDKLSDKSFLESIEFVTFNTEELYVYKEMYKELAQLGFIVIGNFEDPLWLVSGEFNNFKFHFINDIYGEINLALKCYSVQKIYNRINLQTVQANIKHIREAIQITRGFRLDHLEQFENAINHFSKHIQYPFCNTIREFLTFYNHPHSDIYYDLCLNYNTKISNVRKLPNYHDILVFDYALDLFFQSCTFDEERLQYFPIFLWWRITRIVPMRPIELYSLHRECVTIDEEGRYWMVLPRKKKASSGPGKLEITDTIQVNQEVFDLIEEYKRLTSIFAVESSYLISYKAYRKYVKTKTKEKIHKKIGAFQFINLIDRFYDEIIEPKFGNLERLKPGDTRHFAFCNMMLQGFNMLTIARIGGHSQLETQLHYHSHLDHFAHSFVHHAAQMLRMQRKDKWKSNWITETHTVIAKSQLFKASDFQEKYRVEHGYCTDNPAHCKVGDCRFCEFYFFSPLDKIEGLTWLKNHSILLENRLKEQIDLLRYVTKSINYDCENFTSQQSGQERLSSTCNELRRVMDQKAMVDSYLLEDEL
ncbi:site-specific integrase [Lysinibacillus fusiformis]|uniref:site-specific integrase n=1 Tax=Lysinibacillus fusiformis TaxID=28031 RepID=UPI0018E5CED2|nr:site-specific integrase [Lysinibacillus fusiformis]MBI6865304.1 site-specific integrase [Lysinibacillus fusiformis]